MEDQENKISAFKECLKKGLDFSEIKKYLIDSARSNRGEYVTMNMTNPYLNLPEFSNAFLVACLDNIRFRKMLTPSETQQLCNGTYLNLTNILENKIKETDKSFGRIEAHNPVNKDSLEYFQPAFDSSIYPPTLKPESIPKDKKPIKYYNYSKKDTGREE